MLAQRHAHDLCHLRFEVDFRAARDVLGGDVEAAAARGNDRGVSQEVGDGLHVQGCRHHDQPQILAQVPLAFEAQRKPQVGIQAAFMELVEDHAADARETRVVLQHPRENALGDHFDARLAAHACLEPGAKSDSAADGFAEQMRHAAGDGARRDAPRLEHQDLLPLEPGALEQEERHHGALAGARRSLEQHAAAVRQRLGQGRQGFIDRQVRQRR